MSDQPDNVMISKQDFRRLSPWAKGYLCYKHGRRSQQPHVPDRIRYEKGTKRARQYEAGRRAAILEAQDNA